MELETDDPVRRRARRAQPRADAISATATATATGRPAPAPSNCASPSCARAATSRLPGAAADGREGADRGDPGGLHPGHLNPLGRRPGQGLGMEGISKSQVSRLCGEIDERVQAFLTPPDRGRLALCLAGRHLRQECGATTTSSRSPSSSPSASTPMAGARCSA